MQTKLIQSDLNNREISSSTNELFSDSCKQTPSNTNSQVNLSVGVPGMYLTDSEWVNPIAIDTFRACMDLLLEIQLPCAIGVESTDDSQIACGKINFIEEKDDWITISGNSFNLLLRIGSIHSLWVVHRPITAGITSSLELYDYKGTPIARFFGDRSQKGDEEAVWRDILSGLPGNEC